MKAISKIQVMALVSFALLISACQKDTDYLSETVNHELNKSLISDATIHATEGQLLNLETKVLYPGKADLEGFSDFEFHLIERNCTRSGKSFSIIMDKDRGYRFHWDADGEVISRTDEVKCVSANLLSVYVTRVSDGYTKYVSMQLLSGPDLIEAFSVALNVSECFSGGATVEVSTVQDAKSFGYLWEVDGHHAGHFKMISCTCGDYATAIVTRLKDGARVRKTVPLPSCSTSDN